MQKYQVHKAHLNNVCHLDPQEGVYLASDVEGMTDRLLKVMNDRIAELEQQLVGANQTIALFMGPDGEQHIERFTSAAKRPDLCEMEPPDISHDLSNGVVCIGCWNELAQRAGKQAAALESMNDRIAELEKALREMSAMYPYVWDRVDGCLVCMPENVARFDAAHQQALNALMVK